MPRLLFVVISIFVNVPTHAQTSGPTPPPARVVFTKIDTISGPFCAGETRGMHAWPSSEAFELSLSEYTPNAGTSGYTVQTAGSSGCDKTYNQETLEHGYFWSTCSHGLCDYNFSLSVGYVDAPTSAPTASTCLPLSSGSCLGTTGGWNNQVCMSKDAHQYCCCGGEGYFCRDEPDCPSPAPVPSPGTDCDTSCTGA